MSPRAPLRKTSSPARSKSLTSPKAPTGGKSAPAKADSPHAADKKRDAIGLLIVGDPPPLKASADKANKADKADKADKRRR